MTVRTDLTEPDPVTDAVVARGGMLLIGLLFITFTLVIQWLLLNFLQDIINNAGIAVDIWQFLVRLIATLICLPIIAIIQQLLKTREDSTLKGAIAKQFSIYSITKPKLASQLKHALLMWLIVFVPLDFVSYLIPGMLEFQVGSLYNPTLPTGLYFTVPVFGVFITISIIVHLLVSVREETFYRGVLQFWGQERAGVTSALVISSIFFGLSHFGYWFNDMTQPIYFPLWWGFSGLLVGLMLGFYLRTTGRILPMILAHWWNNVVSTIAIWMYLASHDEVTTMTTLGIWLYLPLICCGVVLLLVWRRTLGKAVKKIKKDLTSYRDQPSIIIFFDILFGLGIWLVLLLIGG